MTSLAPTWTSDCGTVKLWLGDCREVMATWPDGAVDCVVTDPPYGIGADRAMAKTSGSQSPSQFAPRKTYRATGWDDNPAPREIINRVAMFKESVIWGGNFFEVPPASKWLVWDKRMSGNWADCELAWTNIGGAVRKIEHLWSGGMRKNNEPRIHPTQKPLDVMAWCIGFTKGQTIADPFMGSGTTGVAAVRLGRSFWGVEIDPGYFEIAKRRIQDELDKAAFLDPPPRETQGVMFND